MSKTDRSSPVRPGEELPIEPLLDYLSTHLPELSGPPVVEQFPAGFSNLTYLLRFPERELVLRRPPIGAKIKTAHDMSREYRILSHLYPVYKKVPRPFLFCEDESILGAPFYVMERVKGIILRAKPPAEMDLYGRTTRKIFSRKPDRHVVDLSAVFDGVPTRIFVDWVHVIPAGNKLVADRMYKELF